jgi:hypothetical protein
MEIMSLRKRIADRLLRRKTHGCSEVMEEMARKEIVFHAPPLSDELVRAIKLITPDIDLRTNEKSRQYWELDQNLSCWAEYEALSPILKQIPKPAKVLEIGPGFGRSVVFFSRKLDWPDTEFHLFEANGERTRYTMLGPRFEDSFCGNLALLEEVLKYNAVTNFTIFDAKKLDFKITRLPSPYDVIYSFYAIGFHWSLEHFLDDVLSLMHDRSVALFTVGYKFLEFEKLRRLHYRLIDATRTRSLTVKMLVLSKSDVFTRKS